jgi:addiction module RelE/StbE family toxin
LQKGEQLAPKYSDHSLSGNWSGYRDCHVKPDLTLKQQSMFSSEDQTANARESEIYSLKTDERDS